MKQVAKRTVDLAMVVLLPFLMLEILIGQETHEWLGAGMLALFAASHLLNLGWWRGLLKPLFDGDIRPFEQSGKLTPEASGLMKRWWRRRNSFCPNWTKTPSKPSAPTKRAGRRAITSSHWSGSKTPSSSSRE